VTEGWQGRIVGGVVHGTLQTAALALAVLLWRRSPGWSASQVVLYFASLVLIAPVVGRALAHRLLRIRGPLQLWRAWPVGVAALLVLLVGHGFEDAGLGPAAPLISLGVLAFVAGVASFWNSAAAQGHNDAVERALEGSEPGNVGMTSGGRSRRGSG
jgi:hypothetical protein